MRHRAYWRRDTTEAGAEVELTDNALARLEALRLRIAPTPPCSHDLHRRATPAEPTIEETLVNSVLPEPAPGARRLLRAGLIDLFVIHRGVLGFATGDCCSGATMAPGSRRWSCAIAVPAGR